MIVKKILAQPRSRGRGVLTSTLVAALIVTSLPSSAEAKFRDKSCDLPGAGCGLTVPLITLLVAAGAGAAFVIYYKTHKGGPTIKLDAPPVRFDGAVRGQPTEKPVHLVNKMNDAITVKSVVVEDPSGAFTISDARRGPFTMASQEPLDIPVKLTANNPGGKARLRLVVSAPRLKKDSTKFVIVSYGEQASKLNLKKLIPKR